MKRYIRWLSPWFCLCPVASYVHGEPVPAAPPAPAAMSQTTLGEYRLGPQDVLVIRVARHEEMGAEVTVLDDGRIMVPRIGELQVADRTPQEVQAMIAAGLKKTLVDPQVSVVVKMPRSVRVYVSGAVKTPGGIPMRPGWRVSEAVAQAGGLLVKPERSRATIFRRPNQTITLDLAAIYIQQDVEANLALEPGDNLDIQEEPTRRVYVGGAVTKAGPVEVPKGGGITEAVALAGGVTLQAAPSRTIVQRLSGEQIPVDLDAVLNQGQPAPTLKLETGDQIIVPENRKRIAVLGLVRTPGVFPLRDGTSLTVAEAVSLAGGVDKRARTARVGIIRVVDGKSTITTVDLGHVLRKGKAEQNPVLQDGDIVFVPETGKPDWTKVIPGAQAIGSLWYFLKQ